MKHSYKFYKYFIDIRDNAHDNDELRKINIEMCDDNDLNTEEYGVLLECAQYYRKENNLRNLKQLLEKTHNVVL